MYIFIIYWMGHLIEGQVSWLIIEQNELLAKKTREYISSHSVHLDVVGGFTLEAGETPDIGLSARSTVALTSSLPANAECSCSSRPMDIPCSSAEPGGKRLIGEGWMYIYIYIVMHISGQISNIVYSIDFIGYDWTSFRLPPRSTWELKGKTNIVKMVLRSTSNW